MKEASNKISVDKFVLMYKHIYGVGDCKKASLKTEERVEGFKAVELNIMPTDGIYFYVGKHWIATDGKVVIDLTAPAYFRALKNLKVATSFHINNLNNVMFQMNVTEYEKRFKEIIKVTERLDLINLL